MRVFQLIEELKKRDPGAVVVFGSMEVEHVRDYKMVEDNSLVTNANWRPRYRFFESGIDDPKDWVDAVMLE